MTSPQIAGKEPIAVPVKAGQSYWWCACGQSKNQPFCDGSHKGSSFTPVEFVVDSFFWTAISGSLIISVVSLVAGTLTRSR